MKLEIRGEAMLRGEHALVSVAGQHGGGRCVRVSDLVGGLAAWEAARR